MNRNPSLATKDSNGSFNPQIHVLYSSTCKKIVREGILQHYPKAQLDEVWSRVHLAYLDYLTKWNKDLGGKKNFHNGQGGTYDCILLLTYYAVCKEVTSLEEIEKMEEKLILPSFRKLKFVNCNKPFFLKLMYKAFVSAKSRCDKWDDYRMEVEPFAKGKPIRYRFTTCPVAEFAKTFGLEEVMPALCNVDYPSMECLHARLIRQGTLMDSEACDYAIVGDQDEYAKQHPEIRDNQGFRRNPK